MTDVGARIRELRKARGLTLREVAERVGWSASYLSQLEKGKQKWNRDNLTRLAEVLGVAVIDFFRDTERIPTLTDGEAARALFALERAEYLTEEERRMMDREIADFIQYLRDRRSKGHAHGG